MVDEKVKDIMKAPVQAIKIDKTIRQAASLMKSNDFGSLLVIINDEIGMLTERDLVHALAEYGENSSIKNHLSVPLISIDEDEEVKNAIELMISKNIRRLAVKGAGNKIVGIVTMRDIVHLMQENIGSIFE